MLKEFMKHVHPDFFATAPDQVKVANSKGVQEVNEYFQTLKNFTDPRGVEEKEVSFFIKNSQYQPESDKHKKPKGHEFLKFNFQMLSLKDGSSPEIKQKHYNNNLKGLMTALNDTLDRFK